MRIPFFTDSDNSLPILRLYPVAAIKKGNIVLQPNGLTANFQTLLGLKETAVVICIYPFGNKTDRVDSYSSIVKGLDLQNILYKLYERDGTGRDFLIDI